MSISVYKEKFFLLSTEKTSYALYINNKQLLCNLYWGERIDRIEDFDDTFLEEFADSANPQKIMEECSSFGGMRFKETSMKVTFSDEVRDFRYEVKDYSIENDTLTIVLEDVHYSLRIYMKYRVFEEENIIEKWREAENFGEEKIALERFYSAEYGIEGTGFETLNFNGHWGSEFQQYSEPIESGKKVYESLYGLTAHNASPFFAIHKNANESQGEVYYGVLQYSGNFKTVIEPVSYGYVNILSGISDSDFEWILRPGEVFKAPSVFSGYSNNGFTDMTHTLSIFSRKHVMPSHWANKPLPVLYNSWYSTFFDVHCDDQIKLAEKASEIGVELFVIDDGWFEGRINDKAGLGDWYVDKNKFPDGLTPLIKRVNELGMDFGIWIEPEMVNANSNLYKSHPDWIYRYNSREVLMGRNQYMLDLTNPEVIEYLIKSFDELLSENKIAYIKWDMNRYASEIGSNFQDPKEFKSIWYKNTQGFYEVIKALRELHPTVEFEACASGGGRVDFGSMAYFDEYWPSDNTDPLDRLYMQEAYSLVYPIKYMRAWYTHDFGMNNRSIPLQFSMYSAMCGSLGIGTNLYNTDAEELQLIKRYIEEYKYIRNIVQFGDLYRLKSFRHDEVHVVQYATENSSALFIFLDHARNGKKYYRIKLKGLDSLSNYHFEINGTKYIKSGSFLMNKGINIHLKGDYDSKLIHLNKM
ncbi:alpha-galactosidase [Bacillus sp. FJAT-49711]|uniref:alpha-galactosidase n=1 Tax=Bacillus sp. FJAT-49711 TaxID=2833585 RepID=UPI001BC90045|nr:alpha-galactosidase [Bacillus sp. FJAT-49711]MBS4219086.1 alpha-galactosidase [Bacillus sp. FJAT-49711]